MLDVEHFMRPAALEEACATSCTSSMFRRRSNEEWYEMYEEHHEYRDATMKTTNAETRDRSRSPKKEADEAPKNENAGGAKKRQSSEDRRAMIATWVQERSSELEAQAAAMHSSLVATLPKMPGVRMPAVPMFVAPPAK